MIDISPLHNRDLVITGVAGYVGSHFLSFLYEKGLDPISLGRSNLDASRLQSLEHLASHAAIFRIMRHDDTVESLAEAMSLLKQPIVINLAGLFISDHTSGDVPALTESNLVWPVRLFDAMRLAQVRSIVNVGTIWEHDKESAYAPVNLYASMKSATERILEYYVQAEGYNAVTLKLFDTYGGSDPRRKLLPLLREIAGTQQELPMSSGAQYINLCHIDDICDALLTCAVLVAPDNQHHIRAFTRTDERLTLRELVDLIVRVSGRELNIRWGERPEHPRQQYDFWKEAPRPSGWQPKIPLEKGLKDYFQISERHSV